MDKNFLNVPVIGRIYKPLLKFTTESTKRHLFLYPKPTQSTLHLYNLNYFRNISFNIVRPFMLRAPSWSLPYVCIHVYPIPS